MSFNYADVNFPDAEQTIGIQNGDFTIGLQVAYDQPYVTSQLTVLITSGWLSAEPSVGSVSPNGTDAINIIFDATLLSVGTYTGSILVSGRDINHEVGQATIPVTLTVGAGGGCVYVTGDVNNNGFFNGVDLVYAVAYFKGGPVPPYSCECTPGNSWFVSGDVNGSCNFNGTDITYAVSYFKGGPLPIPCSNCPPRLIMAPDDGIDPAVVPAIKGKATLGNGTSQQ
jgi:hypothetical protein